MKHEFLGVQIHGENHGGWHSHWLEVKCRHCGHVEALDMPMDNGAAVQAAYLAEEVLPLQIDGCPPPPR